SLKMAEMARAVLRAGFAIEDRLSMQADFSVVLPAAPDATPAPADSAWGGSVWGTSAWGAQAAPVAQQPWHSVGGTGYALAPALQVTSCSIVPLDAGIVRLD